jgi:hypothetical protein
MVYLASGPNGRPRANRGTAAEEGVAAGLFDPALPVEECQSIALAAYDRLSALSGDPNRAKAKAQGIFAAGGSWTGFCSLDEDSIPSARASFRNAYRSALKRFQIDAERGVIQGLLTDDGGMRPLMGARPALTLIVSAPGPEDLGPSAEDRFAPSTDRWPGKKR